MAQGTTKGVPIDIDPTLAADSDLLVPSQKAVKAYAQPQLNGTGFVKATGTTISYDNSTYLTSVGTGVTNQLTYWSGTNSIASLSTGTYPSLTELSYVKGVTSAIQTQIDSKITGGSVYLTSDFSTSSTTAQNTGLKFNIAANERYSVTIVGTAAKATTTTGLKIAIGAPSGATIKGTEFRGQAAVSTALQNSLITAINTLGATFATGAGVEVPFRAEFVVVNGANAGVIELQLATVTSNTATVYALTRMDYFKTTGI